MQRLLLFVPYIFIDISHSWEHEQSSKLEWWGLLFRFRELSGKWGGRLGHDEVGQFRKSARSVCLDKESRDSIWISVRIPDRSIFLVPW